MEIKHNKLPPFADYSHCVIKPIVGKYYISMYTNLLSGMQLARIVFVGDWDACKDYIASKTGG